MDQSPTWEATSHSASQEIYSLLWNQKFHYRGHKSTLLVPILSQITPVITLLSYFPKIHSTITFLCTPRSCKWSFLFRFSKQNIVCMYLRFHACYMPRQSHPPWYDHPNNTWWNMQVLMPLIMQSVPASRHFLLLCPNIVLISLFSNTLNLCSSLCVRDQV